MTDLPSEYLPTWRDEIAQFLEILREVEEPLELPSLLDTLDVLRGLEDQLGQLRTEHFTRRANLGLR